MIAIFYPSTVVASTVDLRSEIVMILSWGFCAASFILEFTLYRGSLYRGIVPYISFTVSLAGVKNTIRFDGDFVIKGRVISEFHWTLRLLVRKHLRLS